MEGHAVARSEGVKAKNSVPQTLGESQVEKEEPGTEASLEDCWTVALLEPQQLAGMGRGR